MGQGLEERLHEREILSGLKMKTLVNVTRRYVNENGNLRGMAPRTSTEWTEKVREDENKDWQGCGVTETRPPRVSAN